MKNKKLEANYELTNEIKVEIITYCRYILNNIVSNKFKEKFKNQIPFFLYHLFKDSLYKFLKFGTYNLYENEINDICMMIDEHDQLFQRFKKGEIELVAIAGDETFIFNTEPGQKLKYNKKLKTWEKIENSINE